MIPYGMIQFVMSFATPRLMRLTSARTIIMLGFAIMAAGCLMSIDTDAHAPGQLEWLPLGCEQAVAAGVDADQVVNTWDADRLLAWAGSHDRS